MRLLRRSGLVLLLLVAGLVPVAVSFAAQTPPKLTVTATPMSSTVFSGSNATYSISVTSANGFTGTVTLCAQTSTPRTPCTNAMPSGLTPVFSPATLAFTKPNMTLTSTLTIATGSTSSGGTTPFNIVAASGSTIASTAVSITVNKFTLSASPSSQILFTGESTTYAVTITRSAGFTTSLSLSASGLPIGTTASFSPNPTSGTTSTLTIAAGPLAIGNGTYAITISGGSNGAGANVQLVLNPPKMQFTISGNPSGSLAPGAVARQINLALANPNKQGINVTALNVAIGSITRSQYAIDHNLPCTSADYTLTQYSGGYPITVPGQGSTTLSAAGKADTTWPSIRMINANRNQDGCKNATVNLTYSGTATGPA